ncbi:hypothetical protein [Flavobacterium sp. DSP2-3-1]|uniref:hypothetical protein n=1 Tax=Flavobacterium sp. DSP2-3-1 TaxID=2804620 RepID=UPI003CF0567B
MSKVKEKNIGFEVLTENNEHVVYKRVLSSNIPNKVRKKREMELPKVTISYFEKDDIERLHAIQAELANTYVIKKDGEFILIIRAIKDFLIK